MIGPLDSFVWGSGGAQLTPTQIDAQRKVAQALMAQGSDYSPVQSWTQGASRVAQAIFGGMQARDANESAKSNMAMEEKLIAPYLPGGTPQTPSVSTPMGQTSIPSGSIDPRLSSAISTVASAHPDISPEYMTRLALVENGGRVEGGSSLSSAKGPFQFLDGTARQYGLGNPNDPNQSAEAAARLTLDNKAALTQALGREPTPGELYLAHQQGSGGAINLLSHPNAPVESVIGAAAARNNAAAPGMTAGQFAGKWTGKFGDIVQTVDPAQKNIIDAQADDPAAIPVNAQPTQGFAIPGQAQAPAVPMINPGTFAKAAPYLSPFTQKFLGGALLQQMEAARKQADPSYQMDLQIKQGQLSALPLDREAKQLAIEEARNKLTPFGEPSVDAQGNLVQRDALNKVSVLKPAANAPTSVQEYEYYRAHLPPGEKPIPYDTWSTAKARASATNINNNVGGGSDKQVFDTFAENTKEARAAATGLTALRNARQALQGSGGVITGAGADGRLMLQKVGAAFGVVDPTAIQNTETFRAAIAPQVAAVMKSTVGTTNISNSDREFAQQAAGGSIKLDAGSITRLLDIMERADVARLDLHRKQLDAVYPDPEKNRRERALFDVQTPEAPKAPGGKTSSGISWSLE